MRALRLLQLMRHLCAGTAATLGLFSAVPATAQDIVASSGPLALQRVEKRSSPQFNANYGFVRVRYYELRVLHRGKPLPLQDAQGRPQHEFRDAFVLADAPVPTLLVGGDRWLLVTERDGQAQVQALSAPGGHSLRWTEGPANEREIEVGRTRTDRPDALTLKGRRHLMLDGTVLLDLSTLTLARPSQDIPAGYTPVHENPLGLSPDGRAIAQLYRGESNSPRDALIIVSSLAQPDKRTLIPLDLQALIGQTGHGIDPEALMRRFEWHQPQGRDAPAQLRLRPGADIGSDPGNSEGRRWHSHYQLGLAAPLGASGTRIARYTVAPVRASMLAAARERLIAHCAAELQPAQAGDPPAERFARLTMWVVPVLLRFDAAERALIAESEHAAGPLWAQQAVRCVGAALEGQLDDSGVLRAHLAGR